jgi:hypothetical protein
LTSRSQAYAVRIADVRTDLDERLMSIASVFVDLRSRATVSPVLLVKLEFGKQAKVIARVEIEMGHRPVQEISVVLLRRGVKHPVVVILVLDAVFKSQRKVHLRVVAKWNVLDSVEKVCALRRVYQKTPILFCRKWIQRRTRRVWSRTWRMGVRSLRPRRRGQEPEDKSDQYKRPTAGAIIEDAG